MESKRKTRKVLKAAKATLVPKESHKQPDKLSSSEVMIRQNGEAIESLTAHPGWVIVEDLIDESIASVVGRKTNGYYYNGEISRGSKSKDYLAGYQEALTQLYNRIKDFIIIKNKMIESHNRSEKEKNSPIINPFLEEQDFNDRY